MIELSKQSGLPLSWSRSGERLVFDAPLPEIEPDIRRHADMEDVLYEPREKGENELYYMYRGIALPPDEEAIAGRGLRYDVTAIRPGTVGREYIKTAGHYHPLKPGTGLTYPEAYEVLHGRAHYLLQLPAPENSGRLQAVILIAAKPGDKVLIPPGFGHITINPGEDFLIMSNWVARDFSSVYEPYRACGGGAYFELQDEEGPEFVPNSRYHHLPPLMRAPVTPLPQMKLITGLPLYRVFQEDQSAFDYLVRPEDFREQFAGYLALLKGDLKETETSRSKKIK